MNGLREIARTLWIGGMWVVGIIVAPVLFSALNNATAGMVAGRMFAAIAWVGLVCIIINHFAVTPIIAGLKAQMNHAAEGLFGGGFATWHAISSLIYLVQSLMGLMYILSNDN